MGRNWRNKRRFANSANFDGDLLGDGFAVGTIGSKGVSSCFCWLYVNAKVVGRPNFAGLRLQGDSFGVRYTEANLRGFSAMDPGSGIEHLDGEVVTAELFDRSSVLFALFFG